MLRFISKLWFKYSGWKIEGSFEPRPDKFMIIVMPHTANFDFFIGVFTRSLLRIGDANFLGKSQLFKFPYGFIFRALGGYPVDRSKGNNLVDAVVEIFDEHDKFACAIAPEGTRSKVTRLKTGFYFIAKKAGIPIIPVGFGYNNKTITIGEPMWPTDNFESDFVQLFKFYDNIKGKFPELGLDDVILKNTLAARK
jgi:1-acyl-sn-glycerol-3-phosphate acyltransferase